MVVFVDDCVVEGRVKSSFRAVTEDSIMFTVWEGGGGGILVEESEFTLGIEIEYFDCLDAGAACGIVVVFVSPGVYPSKS